MPFALVEKRPVDCSPVEIEAFCELVRKGDEVDPNGLEVRVRTAWLLAFGSLDDSLVAVAGIKRPDGGYRAGVFRKSEGGLDPQDFPVELGWLMVAEKVRRQGFGRRTMDSLLGSLAQNVYTTSRRTNGGMHGLLTAYGFERVGAPWRSDRGAYDLVLHVKRAQAGRL